MTNTFLDNLIFFNEKGIEIPVQKTYTLTWEIIPNEQISHIFIENPKGHFLVDLLGNCSVVIDNPGKFVSNPDTYNLLNKFGRECLIDNNDKKLLVSISTIEEYILLNKTLEYQVTLPSYKGPKQFTDVTEDVQNTVHFTINTLDNTVEDDLPIDIFNFVKTEQVINKDANENEYTYDYISELTLSSITEDGKTITFLNRLLEQAYGSYDTLYPYVRYVGSVKQDRVSTEFVATSTFIVLKDNGNDKYVHPIDTNNKDIKLLFEFQNNSEMRFISSDSKADIIWEKQYEVGYDASHINDPLYFSVGFTSAVEGCYQNILAMYVEENNKKFLIGLFTFLTEVEGEDERYRALLGNMGIPDPENYSNIFKSQEPLEELIDWTLVNNKSKELMLNYDNIFPYAGTYKALLNAVKFLGYYDLIFKEWYKIKDQNDRDKYITLQTYDTSTGKSLKSKLKQYNVDFGEFERYRKLNRLTMVYHMDEFDELNTEETLLQYNNDKWSNVTYDIPQIKKIYEYRTDEILAKLYSVKIWLENHILGVNCYISDICGEGLVVSRMKSQAYVTEHYLKDFHSEAYVTPKITNISEFKNSSSNITCSLNEYNSVSFETYYDIPIKDFIRDTYEATIGGVSETVYVSNPIGCMILADELQYELHNDNSSCGSLSEFTDKDYIHNPIIVDNNNIVFYDTNSVTSKIDVTENPIIELAEANIRTVYGNWRSNIKYSISRNTDNAGNQYYSITNHDKDNEGNVTYKTVYRDIKQIFLNPVVDDNVNINRSSEFVYTANNQWNVPLIIIKNYECDDIPKETGKEGLQSLFGYYILEIITGRIIFRNKSTEIVDGACNGAEIQFGYEDLSFDDIRQSIDISYTYIGDKHPVYTYNYADKTRNSNRAQSKALSYNPDLYKSIYTKLSKDYDITKSIDNIYFNNLVSVQKSYNDRKLLYDMLINNISYDTEHIIKVNRLGNYTVTVKAFDAYNRIYVNKSDKKYTVDYITPIDIQMYLNSPKIVNKKSFNESTYFGQVCNTSTVTNLLNSVDKEPIHPQTYRIYDIDPVLDIPDRLEYDNISYAVDVPYEKDYIVFNNFTERFIKCSGSNGTYKLSLLDSNPNPDTIRHSKEVGICVYDNVKKEIVTDIYPLHVKDISIIDVINEDNDTYNHASSHITVSTSDTNLQKQISEEVQYHITEEHMLCYVYNATSLLFTDIKITEMDEYIRVDYDNNETTVIIPNNEDEHTVYKDGDVIKLCYFKKHAADKSLYNHYTEICNEVSYRIKYVNSILLEEDGTYDHIYVLDGIFDLYKLNNKLYNNIAKHEINSEDTDVYKLTYETIGISISPAHLNAVQYILRAAAAGEEIADTYNGATISKTAVTYEGCPLLFNSYLDTNYSISIFRYNPKTLSDMWYTDFSSYIANDNDKLYLYNNKPITIDKDRILFITYDELQDILKNPKNNKDEDISYNILWDWNSYLVYDVPNKLIQQDYIDRYCVLQSKNNILSVTPNILGPQDIQLAVMDIYGNKVVNKGSGLLYVKNPDKKISRRISKIDRKLIPLETQTLSISIGETDPNNNVYGKSINNEQVISADGETVTLYIDDGTFSAPKNNKTTLYPINIPSYAIYYSNGKVLYNKGAKLQLLDENGKEFKDNRMKVKFNKASKEHKHVVKNVKVRMLPMYKSDSINPRYIDIPIKQYGSVKTSKIYGLRFSLHDIEQCGMEQINYQILSDMIYNVSYSMERTDGSIEHIKEDNIYKANLKIKDVQFMSVSGKSNSISENKTGNRKLIGNMKFTMQFYVHGVKEEILTTYICPVYQE